MSRVVVINLDGPLAFSPFDIPDSSPAVQMALLRDEPSIRARTLVVEFPPGFSRPGPGCYVSSEEMVVLAGTLLMSGLQFAQGDWGYVPPLASRVNTIAAEPVRVFARFSGPAKWLRGEGDGSSMQRLALHDAGALPAVESVLGDAHLLRGGERDSAWFLQQPPHGSAPCDMELLSIATHDWSFVPEGEAIPDLEGPMFCRTFSTAKEASE